MIRRLIKQEFGYLLPATILLGLGVSIMSGAFLQFTATSNQTLNSQSYQSIAQEAARSGLEFADGCLSNGDRVWSTLTPGTTCTGSTSGASIYLNQNGTEWRSTFSVSSLSPQYVLTSTGTVEVLNNGTVVKTYTATSKMTMSNLFTSFPISTGESITDIKNDSADCAIANGKLYCWGANGSGQVGDGTNVDRSNPTLVQGALAGKTVTKVSVAEASVCAIADGLPYCWGDNSWGQLGDGSKTSRNIPTAGIPTISTGPLSGKMIKDISTSSFNNPASVIWPFASAYPHTCALTEDGAVSCWGYGGYRQNTGGGQRYACFIFCLPVIGYWSYPSYDSPNLTIGYSDTGEVLSGKKSERIGASSHDSCSLAEGRMICWGVQAPLNLLCNSVLFSDADLTLVPFNGCVAGYSNGYDTHSIGGSALSGRFIDANTWDVSANEACAMASKDFVCFGTTPAFGLFWLDSWGAPWTLLSNADVTDSDNGDNVASWGLTGLYCLVDRGVAKCSGSPLNPYTGTGTSGYKNMQPLITTTGLAGKTPTKIAAGRDHGCLTANGQLFCWGDGSYGALANGIGGGTVSTPTLTGTGGTKPIGSANGTYAASGQISVGGEHACGVANGDLFCWGRNNYGQLGMGDTNDLAQPQAVISLASNNAVTKVSAGTSHTCAIIYGDLWCWGRNNNGQLGINSTTDSDVPVLVAGNLSGKRVTDVSAGVDGTCAIANGQAYCWGNNASQQLGDGTSSQRNAPVAVSGGSGILNGKSVSSISIGASHACAVANADLYCWGSNANGRTGLNTITGNAAPTLVTGGTAGSPLGPNNMRPSVSQVSAGSDFTCAIINSKVSCWGSNANGRTARGTTSGNQLIPAVVSGSAGGYYATSISAGTSHACAVINGNSSATNGNTYCWGAGGNGRIGNGATTDQTTPTLINAGDTVFGGVRRVAISIAAGDVSTCGVANGVILCWGDGASGKLGNSSLSPSSRPVSTSGFIFVSPYARGPIY